MDAAVKPKQKLLTTKNMVLMAMFGALSGLLMYIQVPVPFAPSFYKLDFCDVPVLVGSFAMGPLAGTIIAALKILISLVLRGTHCLKLQDKVPKSLRAVCLAIK